MGIISPGDKSRDKQTSNEGLAKQSLFEEQNSNRLFQESVRKSISLDVLYRTGFDASVLKEELFEFESRKGDILKTGPEGHSRLITTWLTEGRVFLTLARYSGDDLRIPSSNQNLPSNSIVGYNIGRRTDLLPVSILREAVFAINAGKSVLFQDLVDKGFPSDYGKILLGDTGITDGSVGFLLYVTAMPELRGLNISGSLIKKSLDFLRNSLGINYAAAYGRLAEFGDRPIGEGREACKVLNDYLQQKREDGLHPDWAVRFHQKAGGRIVCGIPYSSPTEHGFMVVYDMMNKN